MTDFNLSVAKAKRYSSRAEEEYAGGGFSGMLGPG